MEREHDGGGQGGWRGVVDVAITENGGAILQVRVPSTEWQR